MCLAIPGELMSTFESDGLLMGKVSFAGLKKNVCLTYVPEAVPGDFVLVHAGFAISKIDADEAARVLSILTSEELAELS